MIKLKTMHPGILLSSGSCLRVGIATLQIKALINNRLAAVEIFSPKNVLSSNPGDREENQSGCHWNRLAIIRAKIEIKAIKIKKPMCLQPVLGSMARIPSNKGIQKVIKVKTWPAGSVSSGACK